MIVDSIGKLLELFEYKIPTLMSSCEQIDDLSLLRCLDTFDPSFSSGYFLAISFVFYFFMLQVMQHDKPLDMFLVCLNNCCCFQVEVLTGCKNQFIVIPIGSVLIFYVN